MDIIIANKTTNKRHRDSTLTRAKILEVAGQVFMERAYDAVGMREIASRAGITAAMINRYFGTKEALFIEVLGDALSLKEFMYEDRSSFGENVAKILMEPLPQGENGCIDDDNFKALRIILHSAAEKGAPKVIQDFMQKQLWQPLILWLGGDHAHERAELIVATMMGFCLTHRRIGGPKQLENSNDYIAKNLAKTLQSYIDS